MTETERLAGIIRDLRSQIYEANRYHAISDFDAPARERREARQKAEWDEDTERLIAGEK